jgi:hypothetical protein
MQWSDWSSDVCSSDLLYFFLGRSDKPAALPFQKWIAGEVIPSIRKTGSYALPSQTSWKEPSTARLHELRMILKEGSISIREFRRLAFNLDTLDTVLLPPSKSSDRARLVDVIEKYALNNGGDREGTWKQLYREFKSRYHRDLRMCAKTRKMSVLDYAETENLIGDLLALAMFIFEGDPGGGKSVKAEEYDSIWEDR